MGGGPQSRIRVIFEANMSQAQEALNSFVSSLRNLNQQGAQATSNIRNSFAQMDTQIRQSLQSLDQVDRRMRQVGGGQTTNGLRESFVGLSGNLREVISSYSSLINVQRQMGQSGTSWSASQVQATERFDQAIRQLNSDIQRVGQSMQVLQRLPGGNAASRTLGGMLGSLQTMMNGMTSNLGSLSSQPGPTRMQFAGNLSAVQNFGQRMQSILQRNTQAQNQVTQATNQTTRAVGQTTQAVNQHAQAVGAASRSTGQWMSDYRWGMRRAQYEFGQLQTILAGVVSVTTGMKVFDWTVGQAANFERYQLQYEVLLQGLDKAKERMSELYNFAMYTPFVMEDVLQADRTLQIFRIRSTELLRLVGDAASITGQQMEEISFWLGRIASGDTGHGLMRLAQMGIVTTAELKKAGLEFNKNNAYMGDFNDLMNKIVEIMETRFNKGMMKASQTGSGMLSTLKDMILLMGRDIGAKGLEVAKQEMTRLMNILQQLKDNGTLDRWSQRLGQIIADLIRWFGDLLVNGDKVINEFYDMTTTIRDMASTIKTFMTYAIPAWLTYKAAVMIAPLLLYLNQVLTYVATAMGMVAAGTSRATAAMWVFNAAADANPIGAIIAVIMALGFVLYWCATHWDVAKAIMLAAMWAIILGAQSVARIFMEMADGIVSPIFKILSYLPLVGNGFANLRSNMQSQLKAMDQSMQTSANNIKGYANYAANALNGVSNQVMDTRAIITGEATKRHQQFSMYQTPAFYTSGSYPGVGAVPKFTDLGGRDSESDGSGGSKAAEKDAVDKIKEVYDDEIKMAQDYMDIYKEEKNIDLVKQYGNQMITTLNNEISDLDKVLTYATGDLKSKAQSAKAEAIKKVKETQKKITDDSISIVHDTYDQGIEIDEANADLVKDNTNKSAYKGYIQAAIDKAKAEVAKFEELIKVATGDAKGKLELEKLKMLKKIMDLTNDIKENTAKFVNEFNMPSGMDPVTLREYKSGNFTGGYVVSGANFIFQVQSAPTSTAEWERMFNLSQDALSSMLDKRRRRN